MCTCRFNLVGKANPCALMIARTLLKNPSFSCTPPASSGSSSACHSRGSSAHSSPRLMWPLPSCTPTAGPLCLCHPVQPLRPHPLSGHLPVLLRGEESQQETVVELLRSGGRVLLTLFQQSYKGFRKKFFKVCYSVHDPTLLDGFPLYWVEKHGLKKPRSLEDLIPCDRKTCEFFSMLN